MIAAERYQRAESVGGEGRIGSACGEEEVGSACEEEGCAESARGWYCADDTVACREAADMKSRKSQFLVRGRMYKGYSRGVIHSDTGGGLG